MADTAQDMKVKKPGLYRITIEGFIREHWSGWLNNMQIFTGEDPGQARTTTLIGKVADQAALRGILCRLWDLNLTIISVQRLEMQAGEKEAKNE